MGEEKALEVVEAGFVELGTIRAQGPTDVVARASEIATALGKIIDDRKLYTVISNKRFVRVEGWTTLGAMLGVMPRELRCYPMQDEPNGPIRGYEAEVELIRATDGAVIGRGSAICTRDEQNWKNRPDYAVRSMAITRATGKAYRLGFSWIMTLAGYEPTPAEEVPEEPRKKSAPKGKKEKAVKAAEELGAVDVNSVSSKAEFSAAAKSLGIEGSEINGVFGMPPDEWKRANDKTWQDCLDEVRAVTGK